MSDSTISNGEKSEDQKPKECLLPFFTNLLNFAKDIENKLCNEKPELTKIFSEVINVLREALKTAELEDLPELKKEVENYVSSHIKTFKTSPELQKVFTKLKEVKLFLKNHVLAEAKEFYDRLHSFFTCPSVDQSESSK